MPVDRAAVTYGQNRAVKIGNRTVYYVMRDINGQPDKTALFRVENANAVQISPAWDESEIVWSYVSPSGRQLLLARYEGEEDWQWTLYNIEASAVKKIKTAVVPGDVITFTGRPTKSKSWARQVRIWWRISVPDLKAAPLGTRDDWNADDVTWIGNEKAVAVAAGGELWRVECRASRDKVWRFPNEYWK